MTCPVKLGAEEVEVVRQVMARSAECRWADGGPDDLEAPIYEALSRAGYSGDKLRAAVEERLRIGQAQYGRLDLANDKRDFVAEVVPELLDAVVYYGCSVVQDRKRSTDR